MPPSHLVPCPGCSRHVRAREDACPFCRSSLPDAVRASPAPRRIVARLPRAAIFAVSAGAVAIAATACSDSSEPAYGGVCDPNDGCGEVAMDASYGGPRVDAGPLDASADVLHDADVFDGDSSFPMVDAIYGGPPLDSGSDATDGD